jgi:hypothetical protein
VRTGKPHVRLFRVGFLVHIASCQPGEILPSCGNGFANKRKARRRQRAKCGIGEDTKNASPRPGVPLFAQQPRSARPLLLHKFERRQRQLAVGSMSGSRSPISPAWGRRCGLSHTPPDSSSFMRQAAVRTSGSLNDSSLLFRMPTFAERPQLQHLGHTGVQDQANHTVFFALSWRRLNMPLMQRDRHQPRPETYPAARRGAAKASMQIFLV